MRLNESSAMTPKTPATPCCEVTSCYGTDMKNWTGLEKAGFIAVQSVGYVIIAPFMVVSLVLYAGIAMPLLYSGKCISGQWEWD